MGGRYFLVCIGSEKCLRVLKLSYKRKEVKEGCGWSNRGNNGTMLKEADTTIFSNKIAGMSLLRNILDFWTSKSTKFDIFKIFRCFLMFLEKSEVIFLFCGIKQARW